MSDRDIDFPKHTLVEVVDPLNFVHTEALVSLIYEGKRGPPWNYDELFDARKNLASYAALQGYRGSVAVVEDDAICYCCCFHMPDLSGSLPDFEGINFSLVKSMLDKHSVPTSNCIYGSSFVIKNDASISIWDRLAIGERVYHHNLAMFPSHTHFTLETKAKWLSRFVPGSDFPKQVDALEDTTQPYKGAMQYLFSRNV